MCILLRNKIPMENITMEATIDNLIKLKGLNSGNAPHQKKTLPKIIIGRNAIYPEIQGSGKYF